MSDYKKTKNRYWDTDDDNDAAESQRQDVPAQYKKPNDRDDDRPKSSEPYGQNRYKSGYNQRNTGYRNKNGSGQPSKYRHDKNSYQNKRNDMYHNGKTDKNSPQDNDKSLAGDQTGKDSTQRKMGENPLPEQDTGPHHDESKAKADTNSDSRSDGSLDNETRASNTGVKTPKPHKPEHTILEVSFPSARPKSHLMDENEKTMASISSITAEQKKSLENRDSQAAGAFPPGINTNADIPRTAMEKIFSTEEDGTAGEAFPDELGDDTQSDAENENCETVSDAENAIKIVKETVENKLTIMELDAKPLKHGESCLIDISGKKYMVAIQSETCAGERRKFIPQEVLLPALGASGIPVAAYVCSLEFKGKTAVVFTDPFPGNFKTPRSHIAESLLQKIAGQLAALHKLKGERIDSLKTFVPWECKTDAFIKYYNDIYTAMLKELTQDAARVFRTFAFPDNPEKIYKLTSKLSNAPLCLCHGSLDKKSLIMSESEDEIVITRWEHAVFAPAAFDIAIVLNNLGLEKEQEKAFIDTYLMISGHPCPDRFLKDVEIFRALEEVRDGIACLAGTYYGIMSGILCRKQAPLAAERLCPVLEKAYERLDVPMERRLKEYRVETAIATWLMERGPAPSEWIPPDASLDEYFEKLKKSQYYDV